MARVRVEDNAPALGSWDEVDQALAIIGDNQRTIEGIEHAMQEAIDNLKQEAALKGQKYIDNNNRLERRIKEFAESHRDEMDGKKSKTLNFGVVGFRKSTKIIIPRAAVKIKAIIDKLMQSGMSDCVKQPAASVDKDALRKYPVKDIVAVGAGIQQDDVFWYEPDRDRLAQ